jgi:predicted GNAT superfamily acetyltransferase
MSREIWGAAERNVVPRELLLTMQLNGGIVQGAFLPDGPLVGFVFGFLGMRDGEIRLCSHQLGVKPEFRGGGIGVALKEAQRDEALRRGYPLITWTFDPLEARNAYINLHRLGVTARIYDRNHYGVMEDELNAGLATDRLEAEWRVDSRTAAGELRGAVRMLGVGVDEVPERGTLNVAAAPAALIGVPRDFQTLKRRDIELARRWRLESRDAFEAALGAGLIATDFLPEGDYVMTRSHPA